MMAAPKRLLQSLFQLATKPEKRLGSIASRARFITAYTTPTRARSYTTRTALKMPSKIEEARPEMFAPGVGTSVLPAAASVKPESPLPTIAIISLGEMGLGIASLLANYHYPLITCLTGRSAATKARAAALNIIDLEFPAMLAKADVLLSIVPPSEALALSQSVAAALPKDRKEKLVYLDLNALSPALSRQISEPIIEAGQTYVDSCILGFPPKLISIDSKGAGETWYRPALPISGPILPESLASFAALLRLEHISPQIGSASGLKMCFGGINKAITAVFTQSYTTAASLGVLDPLRSYMGEYFPAVRNVGEASMLASQYKSYRWIKEMEEVGETFEKEGGWSKDLFKGVGGVFSVVANETTLPSVEGRKESAKGVAGEVRKALEQRRGSI